MSESRPRIVLAGFMGAGKTSVAAELARRLDCRVIDLDGLIVGREGRSIGEIIDGDGESKFREVESIALRAALEDEGVRVIALGGGTWTIERNRAVLAEQKWLTVWLDVPFEVCWDRISRDDVGRPLARDKEQARNLYQARRESYRLCDLRVDAGADREIAAVAGEIVSRVAPGM